MLLLESIELYGIGSWTRIAEHVGRSEQECRQHYFEVYIQTDTFPEPKPAPNLTEIDIQKLIEGHRASQNRMMGAASLSDVLADGVVQGEEGPPETEVPAEGIDSLMKPRVGPAAVKAETDANGWPAPSLEGELSDAALNATAKAAVPAAAATPAAHGNALPPAGSPRTCTLSPHHTAEGNGPPEPVAGAVGGKGPAIPNSTVALSEAQQTGYHAKRDEFDPDYDNEAECIVADLDFNPTDTPEEEAHKLNLITIYNKRLDSRAHHKQYVLTRGLIHVKKSQSLDRRRTAAERELVSKLRVVARYLPQPTFDGLADDLVAEQRLRARIRELQQYRSLGLRTFMEVDAYEAVHGGGKKDAVAVNQPGKSRLYRINMDDAAFESELALLDQLHASEALHRHHLAQTEGRGNEALQGWRTRRGALLDIAALPDAEPLNQQERFLCATERYLPAQFLAIKAETLRVAGGQDPAPPPHLQQPPFRIDPERSARLHEHFKSANAVKPPM